MIAIPQFLDFPDDGQTSEICEFFLKMLQHKNKALYMHSQQVANYAASIAAKLGLPPAEVSCIKTAALLHDIGSLSVPNMILMKAPYLSTREMSLSTNGIARLAQACLKISKVSAILSPSFMPTMKNGTAPDIPNALKA